MFIFRVHPSLFNDWLADVVLVSCLQHKCEKKWFEFHSRKVFGSDSTCLHPVRVVESDFNVFRDSVKVGNESREAMMVTKQRQCGKDGLCVCVCVCVCVVSCSCFDLCKLKFLSYLLRQTHTLTLTADLSPQTIALLGVFLWVWDIDVFSSALLSTEM